MRCRSRFRRLSGRMFENQSWLIEGETLAKYASAQTVLENGQPVAKLSLDTETLAADLRAEFGPKINRQPGGCEGSMEKWWPGSV